MDATRIGKMVGGDGIKLHLLQLHELGYFVKLQEILRTEVTNQLMFSSASSPEFQAVATENMALVKWLIQIDTEAATELERIASEQRESVNAPRHG